MRYMTVAFVFFLLLVGLGSTSRAQTTNLPPGVTCNDNGNNGFTHDACVINNNDGAGEKGKNVEVCKLLQSVDALEDFGFTSFGDCVSSDLSGLESEFGPTPSSFGVFALLLIGWVAVQWRKPRKRELLCQP